MKKTLTIQLVFTQAVTFDQIPELYFWRRLCRQLKQSMCLQPEQTSCQACPRKQQCFYSTVTGENFNLPPGILLETLSLTKRHFELGETLSLKISALGNVGYALAFIEMIFAELSTRTISYLVQTSQIETVECGALTATALRTPIQARLLQTQVNDIYHRYFTGEIPEINQQWQPGLAITSGFYRDETTRVGIKGNMGIVSDESILGQLIGFDTHYWLGLGKI